jgi:hypothetical protein
MLQLYLQSPPTITERLALGQTFKRSAEGEVGVDLRQAISTTIGMAERNAGVKGQGNTNLTR